VKVIALFWAYLFCLGLAMGGMTPYIAPWAAQRLDASAQIIGVLVAAGAAVSMLCAPLSWDWRQTARATDGAPSSAAWGWAAWAC
jgi:uncharacterized membrane protein